MLLQSQVVVDRPVSEVFALWADRERSPEWVAPVESVIKLTEGPIVVGSKFLEKAQLLPGRKIESTVEITAYEKDRLIAATWSGGMDGDWEARFSEHEGGTRLDAHAEMIQSGPLRFIGPVLGLFAKRAMKADLDSFRKVAEAEA